MRSPHPRALERQITGKNVGEFAVVSSRKRATADTIEATACCGNATIFSSSRRALHAGGVIVSYFEWCRLAEFFWTEAEVNDKLYRHSNLAYQQVLQMAKKQKLYMRDAALALGISKSPKPSRSRLFP